MANINDYLIWRGDIPICEEFPFNPVDSLILARFSYLIFHRIDMEPRETIASIAEKMSGFADGEFRYNGDRDLISNLGRSRRFRDMAVTDWVQNNDKATEEQFGAVTVHLSEDEMYLSYIGTDSTILGWKEDFNMGFMEHVPCQVAGREYAERVAGAYPGRRIRIGGHSKGGNVAIYSAITAPKDVQARIVKVCNYDGPGFSKSMIAQYGDDPVFEKIQTYIPQDSIIGRLLEHREKIAVTYSVEKGILQHDVYSWQITRDDLVYSEGNTDVSEDIDKALTDWLEATTSDQRRIVIDAVFELFYSTDSETFGEMSSNLSENLPKVLKKYGETAKEDKELIKKMIGLMAASCLNVVGEREKAKLDSAIKDYLKALDTQGLW